MDDKIKRASEDPYYFASLCNIETPQGVKQFTPYPYQAKLVELLQSDKNIIINKSRQVGCTTTIAIYLLWYAYFHRNRNIIVISYRDIEATEFVEKIKIAYQGLPDEFKGWIDSDNKSMHRVIFRSGSRIQSLPPTKRTGRSKATNIVVIDEAAFIDDFNQIYAAVEPTTSRGGKLVIISTHNGIECGYYKLWDGAVNNRNGFVPFYIHYTDVPEFNNKEWIEKKKSAYADDIEKFMQEYECIPIGSADSVISVNTLQSLKVTRPLYTDGNISIYKDYDSNEFYYAGMDPAVQGSTSDHALVILNNKCEIVCEYVIGNIDLDSFLISARNLLASYKCGVIVEINGIGKIAYKHLLDNGIQVQSYNKESDINEFVYYLNGFLNATPYVTQRIYDELISLRWNKKRINFKASKQDAVHAVVYAYYALANNISLGTISQLPLITVSTRDVILDVEDKEYETIQFPERYI